MNEHFWAVAIITMAVGSIGVSRAVAKTKALWAKVVLALVLAFVTAYAVSGGAILFLTLIS